MQTESSAPGTVIDQTQVRDLPLPTRNFQQLVALTAGTRVPSRTPPSWNGWHLMGEPLGDQCGVEYVILVPSALADH